jgi:hypothetical protein
VDLPHRVPLFVGELLDRAHLAHAGGVDEHIDRLEALTAGGHRALAGVRGGDVQGQPRDRARIALTVLCGALEGGLTAADQQDAGAFGDEPAGHMQTDAPRAAGDDAGAICEPEVHVRGIVSVDAMMSAPAKSSLSGERVRGSVP